ncbi:hypothetical protein [Hyphomonas sp.]|uniref:hypothetical protein n=1 Tax=Hyphomonas sp. TaxID=87 RepID=UPI003D2BB3EF
MWTPREAGDWLAVALVTVVVASIAAGLVIIGGPAKARQEQQDSMRLQALAETAMALNCYNRGVGTLPDDMSPVRAAIEDAGSDARLAPGCRNVNWRDDPVSGEAFEIITVDDRHAEICAVFARPGRGDTGIPYYGLGVDHINSSAPRPEPGRFCYTVDIAASPG